MSRIGFALAFVGVLAVSTAASGQSWGRYHSPAQVEFGEGRLVRVMRDFVYVDPRGLEWRTPAGHKVDGASIPRILWSYAGGPFAGPYRDASIIHDYYCDVKSRPWKDVHRAFYEAMRASGVREREAKEKYAAVYKFGPRWGPGSGIWHRVGGALTDWPSMAAVGVSEAPELTIADERQWDAFAADLANSSISLDEMEARIDAFQLDSDVASQTETTIGMLPTRPQTGAGSIEDPHIRFTAPTYEQHRELRHTFETRSLEALAIAPGQTER